MTFKIKDKNSTNLIHSGIFFQATVARARGPTYLPNISPVRVASKNLNQWIWSQWFLYYVCIVRSSLYRKFTGALPPTQPPGGGSLRVVAIADAKIDAQALLYKTSRR